MFEQQNSQQSARYAVNPFQRFEIIIGGPSGLAVPDRSQGTLLPEPQGVGLYIERADFPCLLSLVTPGQTVGQSIVARDGMQVECFFKGIYLAHPILTAAGQMSLSFITFASPDAVLVNQIATPAVRGALAYVAGGNAAAATCKIFVPPGVRALNGLQVAAVGTVPTDCSAQPVDKTGTVLFPPTSLSQQIGGVLVTYNGGNSPIQRTVPVVLGPNLIASFANKILLPSACVEVDVQIVGTAMGGIVGVSGWFE